MIHRIIASIIDKDKQKQTFIPDAVCALTNRKLEWLNSNCSSSNDQHSSHSNRAT